MTIDFTDAVAVTIDTDGDSFITDDTTPVLLSDNVWNVIHAYNGTGDTPMYGAVWKYIPSTSGGTITADFYTNSSIQSNAYYANVIWVGAIPPSADPASTDLRFYGVQPVFAGPPNPPITSPPSPATFVTGRVMTAGCTYYLIAFEALPSGTPSGSTFKGVFTGTHTGSGTSGGPPIVILDPISESIVEGHNTGFLSTCTGATPLSVQWQWHAPVGG